MAREPTTVTVEPGFHIPLGRFRLLGDVRGTRGLGVHIHAVTARTEERGEVWRVPGFVLLPALPLFDLARVRTLFERRRQQRRPGRPAWLPGLDALRTRWPRPDRVGEAAWEATRRQREAAATELERAEGNLDPALRRIWLRTPWVFTFPELHVEELAPDGPYAEASAADAAFRAAEVAMRAGTFWPPGKGGKREVFSAGAAGALYVALCEELDASAGDIAKFVAEIDAPGGPQETESESASHPPWDADRAARRVRDDAAMWRRAQRRGELDPVLLPADREWWTRAPADMRREALVSWLRDEQTMRSLLAATGSGLANVVIAGARYPALLDAVRMPFLDARCNLPVGHPVHADLARFLGRPADAPLRGRVSAFVPPKLNERIHALAQADDPPLGLLLYIGEAPPPLPHDLEYADGAR